MPLRLSVIPLNLASSEQTRSTLDIVPKSFLGSAKSLDKVVSFACYSVIRDRSCMCEQKLLTSRTCDEQKLDEFLVLLKLYCMIELTFPAVCVVSAVALSENIRLFTANH